MRPHQLSEIRRFFPHLLGTDKPKLPTNSRFVAIGVKFVCLTRHCDVGRAPFFYPSFKLTRFEFWPLDYRQLGNNRSPILLPPAMHPADPTICGASGAIAQRLRLMRSGGGVQGWRPAATAQHWADRPLNVIAAQSQRVGMSIIPILGTTDFPETLQPNNLIIIGT